MCCHGKSFFISGVIVVTRRRNDGNPSNGDLDSNKTLILYFPTLSKMKQKSILDIHFKFMLGQMQNMSRI